MFQYCLKMMHKNLVNTKRYAEEKKANRSEVSLTQQCFDFSKMICRQVTTRPKNFSRTQTPGRVNLTSKNSQTNLSLCTVVQPQLNKCSAPRTLFYCTRERGGFIFTKMFVLQIQGIFGSFLHYQISQLRNEIHSVLFIHFFDYIFIIFFS